MKPLKSAVQGNGIDVAWTDGKNVAEAPPRGGDRHAVLERHLERYPWARLSDDRGDQEQLSLLLDAAGEEGRAWTVQAPEGHRLPGPLDADIYVALGALYNSQIPRERRHEERRIHTTLGELAELMGRERGGKTYNGIRTALRRLRNTNIRAVRTFREGDIVAEEREFSIIGELTWKYRRDGDKSRTAVEVEFSRAIAESIARGHFRLLNVAAYFAIETPTARRLYRFLDARRWRGAESFPTYSTRLRDLARDLPIDRAAPSHIRRTLDPAHEQLIAHGFLAAAEYEDRPVPGRRRPDPWVIYTFAPAEPAPAAARHAQPAVPRHRDPREDPDYVGERVREILALLRDEHSAGFYAKCAKAFDRDALDNLVGGVRQAIREGLSLDLARKTFTATAKARAKATGVKL